MSPSDAVVEAQAKMEEYRASGVRLGWLISRKLRRVWVYRAGTPPELLQNPTVLSGEDVLPEFSLTMDQVW